MLSFFINSLIVSNTNKEISIFFSFHKYMVNFCKRRFFYIVLMILGSDIFVKSFYSFTFCYKFASATNFSMHIERLVSRISRQIAVKYPWCFYIRCLFFLCSNLFSNLDVSFIYSRLLSPNDLFTFNLYYDFYRNLFEVSKLNKNFWFFLSFFQVL